MYQLSLAWLDRAAGYRGMEFRHPLLDTRIIDLLLSVPQEQRHIVGTDKSKPILRRAMHDALPSQVHERTDSAEFSCYIDKVLFGQHRKLIPTLFTDSRLVEGGVIKPETARSVRGGGTPRHLRRMLNLTAMEIWLRQVCS